MEECDILVYDITDSDAARKTFVAMLDEPLVDQVISGHASDDSVAEMFDGFSIKGMHVAMIIVPASYRTEFCHCARFCVGVVL